MPYINEPLPASEIGATDTWPYSLQALAQANNDPDLLVLLAFSGGGARASAMAYGVMLELSETSINAAHGPRRLIDEIDVISSVSGGSFVSAYYGLYGDRLFGSFVEDVLHNNLEGSTLKWLSRPRHWTLNSRRFGRSDRIAEYLDHTLFQHATLADMERPGAPLIVINATDIGTGARVAFTRPFFRLICSDFDRYPVSRAVVASSAVPGLASPITIENHSHLCLNEVPEWAKPDRLEPATTNRALTARNVEQYQEINRRPWLHLVDGGVSDNLALRPFYAASEMKLEDPERFARLGFKQPSRILVIAVNASLSYEREWSKKPKIPGATQVLAAVSSIQMERYNADSVQLVRDGFTDWLEATRESGQHATFQFVEVNIASVPDSAERDYLNAIPTNFSLSEEQVRRLITASRRSLRRSVSFQQFLTDNASKVPSGR